MVTKQHSWVNDGSFPITSLSVTAPAPGLAACQTGFESPGHRAEEPAGFPCPTPPCDGCLLPPLWVRVGRCRSFCPAKPRSRRTWKGLGEGVSEPQGALPGTGTMQPSGQAGARCSQTNGTIKTVSPGKPRLFWKMFELITRRWLWPDLNLICLRLT